jgi:hypothetical protein
MKAETKGGAAQEEEEEEEGLEEVFVFVFVGIIVVVVFVGGRCQWCGVFIRSISSCACDSEIVASSNAQCHRISFG